MKIRPSLNWLLILVPVAIALRYVGPLKNDVALFICSGLAIVPLAGIMGRATEHLAEKMGEGIGGLLNATFGNAAELIIALMALKQGMFGVVKASLTGSIIGNILLVMGVSIIGGGVRYKVQRFNRTAASSSTSSLVLAAIGLVIPTVFHVAAEEGPGGWTPEMEQKLSLGIAIILFATYLCTLYFSLHTHRQLFLGTREPSEAKVSDSGGWSRRKSTTILLVATVFVAWISEFLVGTIEATQAKLGVTEVFIGIIVVAIIGNAAEHSTAVLVALKNKMDLSLGIAIGSSLQIALFVAPLLVFVSYLFGKPMDLEFTIPEVVAVIAAVHILSEICNDGECNWLEGAQLISVYLILAVLFYFLPATH